MDSLTNQQRNILEEYQQNNWNIELAERNMSQQRDSSSIYHNDPDASTSTSALLGNNASPPRRTNKRFLSFFMWPFNLIWRVSWSLLQFFVRLLHRPSIAAPRRDARTEADRFLRDFESTYGSTHPTFFSEGGYSKALSAAKNELKYMLVILCCEEHDDNAKFCRETLTDIELLDFLRQHEVIVWGGNVRYTEAYQVSNTLQATTYPFLAIIAQQQTNGTSKMAVIDRIEGPVSASSIIRRFDSVISRVGPALNHLRMEREQREMERRLRQEQDQAYRDSLRADQQKQEQLEREREAAANAELAKQEMARKRKQYIQYLCQHLPDDTYDQSEKVTKISFRLANGERVIRKFRGEDTLASLYEFIEAYPHLNEPIDGEVEKPQDYVHQFKFTMHSPFPKTVYHADADKKIIDEKGLWPSATLIVDTIEEEDDDDDDDEDETEEEEE